jgi:uncharacterized membrane protein YciS (DUF1049 family)
MLATEMSAAPSVRTRRRGAPLQAFAIPVAVAVGVLLPLARPGAFTLGVCAIALLLVGAIALGGTARAAALSAALVYGAVLVWCYTAYFAPLYAYQGMVDAGPERTATLVVVTLAALPVTWLPLSAERASTVVLWFLYLTGYVPAVIVPLLMTGDLGTVLPLDLALFAGMAIASLIVRMPPIPVEIPYLSPTVFTWMLVGLSLGASAYIAATFGFHALPNLRNVYTTRAQFSAELGGATAGGYIVPWAGNAINPLLMTLGLARRRPGLVAIAFFGQLLIYADTGFKSVFFSIALVPLVYLALTFARRRFGLLAILAAPVILAGGVLAGSLTGELSLSLVRRFFATPGQVGWYFYDYFAAHPKFHLSHSVLSWLFSSGYVEDPPQLVGRVYFPKTLPSANAHFWADAFANFGFAGIIVFTIVMAFFLLIVDGLGQRRDIRVFGPMLAIAGGSLASSALLTTLLTIGLGFGCLLMALMPPAAGPDARAGPPD